MKLLYCTACSDIIRLVRSVRQYQCGKTQGRYLGSVNAVYTGEFAVPVGISNHEFPLAVVAHQVTGEGMTFDAFVIAKDCLTFRKMGSSAELKQ